MPQTTEMQTVEKKYKHLTDHEHILKRSDMYVGTIDTNTVNMWIYDRNTNKFKKEDILFSPALYKIVDEILVNARDHTVRNPKTCKTIKVNLDKDTGKITIWNDGPGIEVKFHKEFKKYVPEMIFGHLRTSSNYEETGKIVGGKNGFGAKLTNIFSTEFTIETVDSDEKKFYRQTFSNNMYNKTEPEIKTSKSSSYTSVSFIPDYNRFGFKKITSELIGLFSKRVYDIAASTNKNVKVYLNDELINITKFTDYIDMYYEATPKTLCYTEFSSRWKIGLIFDSNIGYNQISFVNGILTYNGGTHVKYIIDQVCEKLIGLIIKKNKNLKIKPDQIKSNITLFLDCSIEDPTFNSQVKDKLTTKLSAFGSKCELSDEFIQKFSKTGIIDEVISLVEFKENKELKKTDGKKTNKLRDVLKLEDATEAGGINSHKCRLILTEGDSAKSFALNGLQIIGNKYYGVFPLRGKMINVRRATVQQIMKNEEFVSFKRIMGLKQGQEYKDTKELRYGGILILTDQDADGSHIKGLIINMIQFMWPTLILRDDFIQCLKTPLIKTFKKSDKKNQDPLIFYSQTEFKKWEDEIGDDISKWDKPKYYKGLGTSTAYEAKQTFLDFEKKQINFICGNVKDLKDVKDDKDDKDNKDDSSIESEEDISDDDNISISSKSGSNKETSNKETSNKVSKKKVKLSKIDKMKLKKVNDIITLAFDKKRADDRKSWLKKFNINDVLEAIGDVTYDDFINKELIHFSNADNIRSIPSISDGLKPSLRKILFASFKRGKNAPEIKVAQFAGYIGTETEYHHGEMSLMGAIIGMAQNFPGSNNINLLLPLGNFGFRRDMGKEAASPRYIFTKTNKLAYKIFREEDEPILDFVIEEGKSVEPVCYKPIIPMILINGTSGIGTGFSTDVPPYNPLDITKCLKTFIQKKEYIEIHPYYRGFTGEISLIGENKYMMKGKYEIIDEETVRITEIPIFKSIEAYKAELTSMEIIDKKENNPNKKITDFLMEPLLNSIDATIKFKPTELQDLIKNDKLESYLKLNTTFSLNNMHLYDSNNKLILYDTVHDIIEEFYIDRLQIYKKRKAYQIKVLENEVNILKYKVKFIEDIFDKKIKLEKQKKDIIIARLVELKYPKLAKNINNLDKSYSYLIELPLWSLTFEKIEELKSQLEQIEKILEDYMNKTEEEIWLGEIKEFEEAYKIWLKDIIDEQEKEDNLVKNNKKTKKIIKKKN
jgi:DNA topoisomerase-2